MENNKQLGHSENNEAQKNINHYDQRLSEAELAQNSGLFATTKISEMLEWARLWGQSNSIWPLAFGTSCCTLEFMSVLGPKYDISRFGAELVRFSPKDSDLLIVGGTITEKMAPILKNVYEEMTHPKWVISMGACASSGGLYRSYNVVQGISREIPVDVYVPGCPPTPEAVIDAIRQIQKKIKNKNQVPVTK
jgi:NADH-quinone oxidoreductase subunit B